MKEYVIVQVTLTKTKEMLDDTHKRNIKMADEIFVINVGGNIGSSTRLEIMHRRPANGSIPGRNKVIC